MKRLLLILILTFSFQNLSKADDISDFELEGMSIGDSLLDFFTEDKIQKEKLKKTPYKNDEYKIVVFYSTNSNQYDGFRFHIKSSDKNYTIYSLGGFKVLDFQSCKKYKDEISSDLVELFGVNTKQEGKLQNHTYDKSGKSKTLSTYFNLSSGRIRVICTDWSKKLTKEKKWEDKLTVNIYSPEFRYWLNNKAYK